MTYESGKKTGSKDHMVWEGFTERQHYCVGQYISHMAEALGLGNWHLILATEPCDNEDAMAQVLTTEGRHVAKIRLNKEWMSYSLDDKRHTVVHELLHLYFDPLTEALRLMLPHSGVGFALSGMINEAVRQAEELSVDDLAYVFVRYANDEGVRHYLEGRKR
mgnify:CR=1 FL=1